MRMLTRFLALPLCCLAYALAPAHAASWWLGSYGQYGNDTGGIISWSPEIRYVYKDIAAGHCAQFNKLAKITSVHPWYGDYVAFACVFPRGYDPVKAWSNPGFGY
jgi:hypothetical protein